MLSDLYGKAFLKITSTKLKLEVIFQVYHVGFQAFIAYVAIIFAHSANSTTFSNKS